MVKCLFMGFNNTDRKLITTKAKVLMQQNYLYTPERSLATWPFIEQKILEGKKPLEYGISDKEIKIWR